MRSAKLVTHWDKFAFLGALSQGLKWQGLEADHSARASVEVSKMWIYTSHYVFMA
jgi:hypothetical protein